jgi:hypothetical protein
MPKQSAKRRSGRRGRSSARQQATLIGPVERQIEFSEMCCREFDGSPAVQDRLDQPKDILAQLID